MLLFGHLFESGPSHFTNLRISTKSCSDRLPRRAGLSVILETDQLFVVIICPWMEPWPSNGWIATWLNGHMGWFAGSRNSWRRRRCRDRIGRCCQGGRCCRRMDCNSSSESSELRPGGGLSAATGSGGGSAADSGAEESTRCFFFGCGASTGWARCFERTGTGVVVRVVALG